MNTAVKIFREIAMAVAFFMLGAQARELWPTEKDITIIRNKNIMSCELGFIWGLKQERPENFDCSVIVDEFVK